MRNKFNLEGVVNIKESFGSQQDRDMNPWVIEGFFIEKNSNKIYYQLYSEKYNKKNIFLEESLELKNYNFNIKPTKYLELMSTPVSLDFDDISLQQGKCKLLSRLDADISSEVIKGVRIKIPIISSNMKSVTDSNMAILMRKAGCLGILHRAQSKEEYLQEVKRVAKECDWVAVSIGVDKSQFDLCKELVSAGANIITIDIAQGYADTVIDLGRKIKKEIPDIKIIVGNVITPDFLFEVSDYADAVKAGIASGSVCETKNTAGCYQKQATTILQMTDVAKHLGMPLISDGSIKECSHFSKAVSLGASAVMMGNVLARCEESSGEIIEIDGVRKKVFSGMSSRRIQEEWHNKKLRKGICPEGRTTYLDIGEPLNDVIERYAGALRSCISYVGATDIESLWRLAKFYRFK
jgi:IMP dehydrogenase/GMP reductase